MNFEELKRFRELNIKFSKFMCITQDDGACSEHCLFRKYGAEYVCGIDTEDIDIIIENYEKHKNNEAY